MNDEFNNAEEVAGNKKVRRIKPPDNKEQADAEKTAFESPEGYARESKEKDHQRGEKLKDILHKLVIFGVIIIGCLLIFGIVIWAWHVLVSSNYHWLSMEQVYEIQKIMSSALLALVISDYSKRYLK